MSMQWNPDLYTNKHAFVYEYGASLIQLLAPQKNERILDVGCGAGQLAEQISKSGATVIGIDQSADMIQKAKSNYPQLEFHVMDAANFSFKTPFDAVFSNATMHWVLEKEKAIECIGNTLKKGGRFVLEMGGKGNIATILNQLIETLKEKGYPENAARSVWYFPSVGAYTSLLEKYGFRVVLAQHYDRPTELADSDHGVEDWLEMFGSMYLEGIPEQKKKGIKTDVQEKIREQCFINGKWFADYKRLQILAIKEI